MGRFDDIEQAVSALSPAELLEFRAWFEQFEAARFDDRIERDIAKGKLDGFVADAIDTFQESQAHDL
jgi:hypothetical protein